MNAPMNAEAGVSAACEPRPLYGIGTVARLTGLKPDTLRVWERRYGLGASFKSASGRRQYTQSDLEHLQMIAALVKDGARIGEIANAENKTLQLLLKGRGKHVERQVPPPKPRVVFVGQEMCAWLDEHQGCISSVSALLVRESLMDVIDTLKLEEHVQMLVVDCPAMSTAQIEGVEALSKRLGIDNVLVTYRMANDRWLDELARRNTSTLEFPPEPARLAYEMSKVTVSRDTEEGQFDLGELVNPKPRRYSSEELIAAGKLKSLLDCECPRHIVNILQSLNQFEEYSTQCSIENWQDAAVHACIYAYTNQARNLMEKALKSIIDERGVEFQTLLESSGVKAHD